MSESIDNLPGFDGGQVAVEQTPAGPACAKCEAPLPDGEGSACRSCGWYGRLGIQVEIAPEWEQACSGQPATGPAKSHLEVWGSLIPAWGWKIIGTTVGVMLASLAARIAIADDASLRTVWAVCQLLLGGSLFAACHLLAFFMAASSDTDMGVMDLVVSPLKGWMKIFAKLPERLWVVNSANGTLTAALSAMLIIGGLPYDALWDWGFKPPAKKALLGAIAEKAGGGESDMDMEDAMGQLAENAGVDDAMNNLGKPGNNASGPVESQTIDALIVGYELTPQGGIDRLLLATEYHGKLYYAGRVRPNLTEEQRVELPASLAAAHAPRPFVTVPGSATWVQPRFTCRVQYLRRVESGMLQGIIWEELLGEVEPTWLPKK